MVESANFNPNNPAFNSAVGGLEMFNSTAVGSAHPGMDFVYLSPESLMAFIEAQLQSTDAKIFDQMKEIDGRREAADKLGQITGILKQCKQSTDGKYLEKLKRKAYGETTVVLSTGTVVGPYSNTVDGKKELEKGKAGVAVNLENVTAGDPEALKEYEAVVTQFNAAAEQLDAAGYKDLAATCLKMAEDLANGTVPALSEVEGLLTKVEQTMNSLSSSSQMTMIQLQELMQERQRKIMFVTNAMASMNEASRKIIDNTR